MLDKKFNPKLSDFGLARQGPGTGASHVSTSVSNSAMDKMPKAFSSWLLRECSISLNNP